MPTDKKPLSRVGRTAARDKVRARVAREEKLKAQVYHWCNPLKNSVEQQSQSVQEISRAFHSKEVDLMLATQTARDRISDFEKNLEKMIKDEVGAAITRQSMKDESGRSTLERQIVHLSEELSGLKDKVLESQDSNKRAVSALLETTARSHKNIEYYAVKLGESRNMVDKLISDFNAYCSNDHQQKAYIQRLEVLCKDMEGRVWPWRPNMDRDKSPPPREEEIVSCQQGSASGEKTEWVPWPPSGPVKSSRTVSPGRSTTASTVQPTPPPSRPSSAQPSPPSSRPSSARFRGREPATARLGLSRSDSNPVGSACAVVKVARPSSATAQRSPPFVQS